MQLEAINIEKAFDGSGTILRDINLCLNNGESISITAPSGRGKSTLLSVMAATSVAFRIKKKLP